MRRLGIVVLVVTLLISLYAFGERPARFEVIGSGPWSLRVGLVLNGGR